MAHADYNCCLICDRKMDYSSDAETKAHPCPECVATMRDSGGPILLTQPEVIQYVRDTPAEEASAYMRKIGYRRCFYPNDADDAVADQLPDLASP